MVHEWSCTKPHDAMLQSQQSMFELRRRTNHQLLKSLTPSLKDKPIGEVVGLVVYFDLFRVHDVAD